MARNIRPSDPGTGTQYSAFSKRIINKDGSFNVKKMGLPPSTRDTYQYLIQLGWWAFLGIIILYLVLVNAIFGIIYYGFGHEHFTGIQTDNVQDEFLQYFYFSFQTFTTVGYGLISPIGKIVSGLAAFEAIFGWLSFAIITGILYGRFSRPSARIQFSKNAIIAPYQDEGVSLQFRVANKRKSNLMEMEVTVLLMELERGDQGILKRRFTELPLERNQILFFPLSWTVVHPIIKGSPFFGRSRDELIAMDAEILIMIKGFDDTFSQVVHSRYSYKADEIVWGAKFRPVFDTQTDGNIHLFFNDIGSFDKRDLES